MLSGSADLWKFWSEYLRCMLPGHRPNSVIWQINMTMLPSMHSYELCIAHNFVKIAAPRSENIQCAHYCCIELYAQPQTAPDRYLGSPVGNRCCDASHRSLAICPFQTVVLQCRQTSDSSTTGITCQHDFSHGKLPLPSGVSMLCELAFLF